MYIESHMISEVDRQRHREQNYICESVWGCYGMCVCERENVREWNNPSMYEYYIMYCRVNCWILVEHGDRQE
jgi:hypothetical protein